ncbi:MAG: SET domain-containing protein-lysine N-methyltransferase [Chitinophagaceae bacterium]|nr:SET domain-containing protein-lysine N-methyltransferase [Chitinophagaceae bacterium]
MSATNSITTEKQVVLRVAFAEVLRNITTGQQQLSSLQSYLPGDVLCSFHAGEIVSTPTYLTVQTGTDRHITLRPEFLQYINHSCDPNVFFDTTTLQLMCLKPIGEGEEFTFFYPSTEWEMAQPFVCQCQSPQCLQLIQGASYLSPETLDKYRLTDFIHQQLRRKAEPERA